VAHKRTAFLAYLDRGFTAFALDVLSCVITLAPPAAAEAGTRGDANLSDNLTGRAPPHPRPAQRPVKRPSRRSMKDCTPSIASSVWENSIIFGSRAFAAAAGPSLNVCRAEASAA
jgi:hypothetical protein